MEIESKHKRDYGLSQIAQFALLRKTLCRGSFIYNNSYNGQYIHKEGMLDTMSRIQRKFTQRDWDNFILEISKKCKLGVDTPTTTP